MLPIITLITGLALLGAIVNAEYMSREMPFEEMHTKERADILRSFDWLVLQYMRSNPSQTGTLSWAAIAAANTTPPGMKGSPKLANFRAAGTPLSYTICTPYSTSELRAILSNLPPRQVPTVSREEACVAP